MHRRAGDLSPADLIAAALAAPVWYVTAAGAAALAQAGQAGGAERPVRTKSLVGRGNL